MQSVLFDASYTDKDFFVIGELNLYGQIREGSVWTVLCLDPEVAGVGKNNIDLPDSHLLKEGCKQVHKYIHFI